MAFKPKKSLLKKEPTVQELEKQLEELQKQTQVRKKLSANYKAAEPEEELDDEFNDGEDEVEEEEEDITPTPTTKQQIPNQQITPQEIRDAVEGHLVRALELIKYL